MSKTPNPDDRVAEGDRPGKSWFQVWWPALLLLGSVAFLGLSGIVSTRHPPRIPRTPGVIKGLAQSLGRYESEYDKLPDSPALDFETEGPEVAQLITVLLGKEETGPSMQNPRQIPFLNIRISKHKNYGGLVYSDENKVLGIYDAWGNPLRVTLRPPGKTATTLIYCGERIASYEPAVVFSRGPDQKWGTEDDLTSWTQP